MSERPIIKLDRPERVERARPVIELAPVKRDRERPVIELETDPDTSDAARFARFAESRVLWDRITGGGSGAK